MGRGRRCSRSCPPRSGISTEERVSRRVTPGMSRTFAPTRRRHLPSIKWRSTSTEGPRWFRRERPGGRGGTAATSIRTSGGPTAAFACTPASGLFSRRSRQARSVSRRAGTPRESRSLGRSFKRAFGETPHRYLLRRRVERAKELLRNTPLSVTEISLDVGFRSLGSFSTAFRALVGESPREYTEKLGFEVNTDAKMDDFRWLTVNPPGNPSTNSFCSFPVRR
jgi:AraC-like DNA-binding protein